MYWKKFRRGEGPGSFTREVAVTVHVDVPLAAAAVLTMLDLEHGPDLAEAWTPEQIEQYISGMSGRQIGLAVAEHVRLYGSHDAAKLVPFDGSAQFTDAQGKAAERGVIRAGSTPADRIRLFGTAEV